MYNKRNECKINAIRIKCCVAIENLFAPVYLCLVLLFALLHVQIEGQTLAGVSVDVSGKVGRFLNYLRVHNSMLCRNILNSIYEQRSDSTVCEYMNIAFCLQLYRFALEDLAYKLLSECFIRASDQLTPVLQIMSNVNQRYVAIL